MKALYRLVLPPSDQVVVDGRQIFTQTDLFDVVNTIQTLADSRRASQKDRMRAYPRTQFDNQRNVTCFTCGKVGHKSVDCFMNRRLTNNQRSTSSVAQKPFACFSCGEQGHKSTECPKNSRQKMEEQKQTQMKPKGPNRVNCVSGNKVSGVVQCTINGHTIPIRLDTDADTTITKECGT